MTDRTESHLRRRSVEQRMYARREFSLVMRRLGYLGAALIILIVLGALGFWITEGVSPAYGLEWTLDTITTLGTIHDPPDTAGRVLKACLALLGIGTLFYGLATVAEFFVSGQLSGVLEERRTQRMIDSYSDHFIICGFGRVGRQVARDLRRAGVTHLVIDSNPDNREEARAVGVPYIEREPADDEVLIEAGIVRAKGVIACVDSDSENIFIALTARELRDDILIIARASREESEKKLLRAGADRVISPYKTSGHEMARVALHPQVGGAVEVADYRMEEIEVSPNCDGVGQTIADVRGTSMIVALRRTDGWLETQPDPATTIGAGDSLVALGTPDALERLEEIFQPAAAAKT
ncbi:MAG TPA: NAD-binding protein [Solirubrobacteraceae bacterium]|nr:NAD-binding protein [Solirubrobacteraceae bacterium]